MTDIKVELRKSAFQKRIQSIGIINLIYKDVNIFFEHCYKHFKKIIRKILNRHFFVKVHTNCVVELIRVNGDEITDRIQFFIQSPTKKITHETNLQYWYLNHVSTFHREKIDEFLHNGSNWILDKIVECVINSNKCEYLSTGSSFIELPRQLRKGAIINVKNRDNQCFKWAVLSALFPAGKNAERVQKYKKFEKKLNFDGIKFPVKLSDIHRFERNNRNISVNVYTYEYKFENPVSISPIRITSNVKANHVNLLLIQKSPPNKKKNVLNESISFEKLESTQIQSHYCWIKSLSRLLGKQTSRHSSKKYICNVCLQSFSSQLILDQHTKGCDNVNKVRVDMPDLTNKWLFFRNYQNQLKCPFIVYADTESLLQPCDGIVRSMQSFQKHIPYSIGYYFHYLYDNSKCYYSSYTGEDCADWFANELGQLSLLIDTLSSNKKPINMTVDDELKFDKATHCFICRKLFYPDEVRVRDHCHFTGKFRGAAHSNCNLNYKETNTIPVVFHNLNYDSHFIIEKIANYSDDPINIVPVNSENYVSFTKKMSILKFDRKSKKTYNSTIFFRFIDSFRFMANSLSDLVSFLPRDQFPILTKQFPGLSKNKISLIKKKGIFPYDYVDSIQKLHSNKLPEKTHFFSKLTSSHISDDEYKHAQKVWKLFGIKNMKEYAELYLKTDVLLLADVFENFRSSCMDIYKLDAAHYYTAPSLSWDSMLRMTKIRIELITDVNMLLFIEKGMLSIISICVFVYVFFSLPWHSSFRYTRRNMSMRTSIH